MNTQHLPSLSSSLKNPAYSAKELVHDLNNMLTIILGSVELAKLHSEKNSAVLSELDMAEKASLRAKELIGHFRQLSSGKGTVRKICSLIPLIKDSAQLALHGSFVEFVFQANPKLWPVKIDEVAVREVISNLVINARESMKEGGTIRIGCENIHASELEVDHLIPASRYVRCSIEDEGCGISPADLKKLFKHPFTTKKQKGWHGLGLTSSWETIRSHGGTITVSSQVNKGSMFSIYLPAAESEPDAFSETGPEVVPFD